MDEIDAEIIRVLCKDARTSFRKIGQMLGIGTDTVIRRYKKLKQENKISNATIILSSKAIGIKARIGIYIKLKRGSNTPVIYDRLIKSYKFYGISKAIGAYDFYIELGIRDLKDLYEFMENLREINEVELVDFILYASHDWPLPTLFTLNPQFLNWFLTVANSSQNSSV